MKKQNNSKNVDDILKFKIINKLKSVYRLNSVDDRKESTAEHTWSSLILADYLLNKHKLKLNRLKVYELLMYHDFLEIYTGDFPLSPGLIHKNRDEKENIAIKEIKKLPEEISEKITFLVNEFKEQKTPESKFARLVDVFDAQIHEIDYKEDWKGWTKEFLLNNKRSKCFDEFPEIKKEFLELLDYFEKEGYFNQ